MNHKVYVISANRYNELPFNKEQKEKYIFCVKNGQKELYEQNGCKNVYNTGNLMDSRNFALEHSFKNNNICVQLSDDIKKVTTNKNFVKKRLVPLDEAIEDILGRFKHYLPFNLSLK